MQHMEYAQISSDDANAAHFAAVRAAEGMGVSQSWQAAFDHLLRSAELGSRLGQSELAALSGEWRLAAEILSGESVRAQDWPLLRSSIDLPKLLEPPTCRVISENPRFVGVINVADREMCEWLIARARPKIARASVYAGFKSRVVHEARTGGSCTFRGRDKDLVLAILRARIAMVTKTKVRAMENAKILHYSAGQEYKRHFDIILDPDAPGYAEKFAQGHQRVMTFLLSLTEDYEGGETAFPVIGLRWRGHMGRGLFFYGVEPDGKLDRRTLHAATPVIGGEKWLFQQFIRGHLPEVATTG